MKRLLTTFFAVLLLSVYFGSVSLAVTVDYSAYEDFKAQLNDAASAFISNRDDFIHNLKNMQAQKASITFSDKRKCIISKTQMVLYLKKCVQASVDASAEY